MRNVVHLCIWGVTGLLVLLSGDVSKWVFGCMWVYTILRLLEDILDEDDNDNFGGLMT